LTRQAPPEAELHRWLVRYLLGVSPLLAREIAARATGNPEALVRDAAPEEVALATGELFAPLEDGRWAPHVAHNDEGDVIAFTAYTPYQFDQVETVPDINQAMWRYFEQQKIMVDPYTAARRAVQALIEKTAKRLARQLDKLQEQQVDEEKLQELRTSGELLLTYQNQVPPRAEEVTLTDYAGQPRTIALDARKTAVENAQAYFRRYEKSQRAGNHIPPLLQGNAADRAYVAQLAVDLALAESRPEIDAVRDALADAGWVRQGRRKSTGWSGNPRQFEIEGFQVYVGRNARQNEHITFQRAGPEDLWLHARGIPGAHVIIKRSQPEIPEKVVQRAAGLAAYYSSARADGPPILVDVTQRRFVRRLRGGKHPGLVSYRNEHTLWAAWDEKDL